MMKLYISLLLLTVTSDLVFAACGEEEKHCYYYQGDNLISDSPCKVVECANIDGGLQIWTWDNGNSVDIRVPAGGDAQVNGKPGRYFDKANLSCYEIIGADYEAVCNGGRQNVNRVGLTDSANNKRDEGGKGHWSWSGNMSTTQFKSGMSLNVLYNPKLDCNSAFLILTGNDQITSVGLEIDGKSYDTINVDSKYSDDGTPFVIIGIDNTLINEIKQGQQLSLATNVINLTASLEGSARAFNNSYNNCKLMPQEMIQEAVAESNDQYEGEEAEQDYVWESQGGGAHINLLGNNAAVGIIFSKKSECEQPAFYIAGIPDLTTVGISVDQQPLGQLNLQQKISDDGIPISISGISAGGVQELSQGTYFKITSPQGILNVPLTGSTIAFHEARAFCQNELYQYQLSEQRQAQAYSQDSPTAAVQSFVEGLRQMGDGKELKREMNSGNYGGLDQMFRLGQQMEQNAQNAQRQLERSLGISEAEAQRMGYERVCRDACSSQYAACIKGCGTITNWNCRNACSSNKESCRKRCEM